MALLTWTLSVGAACGAAWCLREAWRRGPTNPRLAWLLGGWALVAAALVAAAVAGGFDAGTMIGLSVVSTLAYILIGATAQRRRAKARKERAAPALDPLARPRRPLRAVARTVLTVVLPATASFAMAAAYAAHGPGLLIDRAALMSWILPLVWGAGLAWTLAEERLLRATIPLAALTAVCGFVAWIHA